MTVLTPRGNSKRQNFENHRIFIDQNEASYTFQNFEKLFFAPGPLETLMALNRTVLLSGRHSPAVTMSPKLTSLQQPKNYFALKARNSSTAHSAVSINIRNTS